MAKKIERLPIETSRSFILSDDTPFVIREAYKAARTNLTFALATYPSKIAVVTSCGPADGKSTNCLNLAITMAEKGDSVLLIDADLRKPIIHSLLKLDNKQGLSSILGGIVGDISKVISKDVMDNLDVLTSGPIPPNPAELLSSVRMEKLINLVGEHYDYVFIDMSPVGVVADAFVLNEMVSGIIFVIKEGFTSHPEIEEAIRRAKLTNGKILGFIKANCNSKKKSNYGYKNYKYNYKY